MFTKTKINLLKGQTNKNIGLTVQFVFTHNLSQEPYVTKGRFFKQSITVVNSEFSFPKTNCRSKTKDPSEFHNLLNFWLEDAFFKCFKTWNKTQRAPFKTIHTNGFHMEKYSWPLEWKLI